jgi:hypothetical protein
MVRLKPPGQRGEALDPRPVVAYAHHRYTQHYVGSVYKWLHLFDEFVKVVRVQDPVPTRLTRQMERARADFAIINGDIHPEYESAIAAGLPYVLFEHDVVTMRGKPDRTEGDKLRKASAVLFTSEEHQEYCVKKYGLEHTWLVPLKPLEADLVLGHRAKHEGKTIAFAGSILGDKNKNGDFGYRCYGSILRDLVALGWTPHIYAPSCFKMRHGKELADIGCEVRGEQTQDALYRHMARCTVGLQSYAPYGTKGSKAYVETCRPNKLWEYLASGIPTLGVNGGRGMAVYDGKWGIAAKGTSRKAIAEALERIEDITITTKMQKSQAIEKHRGDVAEIVEHMMGETCRNRP